MAIPSFLKGDSIVRLLQGIAFGAVATVFLGFNWGGWTLGSTSSEQAKTQSESAVVSALAPICVDNFKAATDATANLAVLKDQPSYKRTGYIEEGGWALFPGSDDSVTGVAKACVKLLTDV